MRSFSLIGLVGSGAALQRTCGSNPTAAAVETMEADFRITSSQGNVDVSATPVIPVHVVPVNGVGARR